MRRPAVVVLGAALFLGACTSDDTPTIDTSGSPAHEGAATTTESRTGTTDEGDALAAEDGTARALDSQQVTLTATLGGDAEFPGPGDEGSGTFTGSLAAADAPDEETVELCYELEVRGLSMPAAAAHVHRGGAAEAGEVVIPLQAPRDGGVRECVLVRTAQLAPIVRDPTRFYVNVHTDDYPDGAVRGQLASSG